MNIFNIIKTTWAKSPRVLNVSSRKVGGITFIKVGRINVSFSISRAYRDFSPLVPPCPKGWVAIDHDGSEFVVAERDR